MTDTSRETVEAVAAEVETLRAEFAWEFDALNEAAALLRALLAERDAALMEVGRLWELVDSLDDDLPDVGRVYGGYDETGPQSPTPPPRPSAPEEHPAG